MKYEFHPLAEIFPMFDDNRLAELKDDIEQHGQHTPIVIYDGKILDGRNRYNALRTLGIEPKVVEYDGKDPLSYVVSLNLHRRHLDEIARAEIVLKIANMRQGERTDLEPSRSGGKVSQEQAAKIVQVSTDTVGRLKKVREKGTTELNEAIDRRQIPLAKAAKIANLPKDEQNAALDAPKAPKVKCVPKSNGVVAVSVEQPKEDPDFDTILHNTSYDNLMSVWLRVGDAVRGEFLNGLPSFLAKTEQLFDVVENMCKALTEDQREKLIERLMYREDDNTFIVNAEAVA